MLSFVLRRAFTLVATLMAASVVIFFTLEVLPGDPAAFMLGLNVAPEALAALREQLGLDAPVLLRFWQWVTGMLQGDFGISYTYRVPVAGLIADRLLVSLPLAIYALALAVLVGIPVGVLAAIKRNGPVDTAAMGLAQIGIALPNFWFAMLLVLLFSVTLRWFSSGGFPGWDDPGAAIAALTLPAVALALPQAAILARVMRSSLLDTLDEDYVRTARAKGLSRRQALWHHALRNALIPVLTIMGLQFSFLLAGGIIIENVFYLPGLGRLAFQAITARDLIVVRSVVMILVFAVVLVTFLVDLGYAAIDPRLRRGRT
ncbi:MAG TPA: ABC transporter permease [Pelagibacterium sp.]|uniref:ABC transporter permease n=1 Tax=Pelagibacterium sp. TaxID=1967288 RepID=UPI002C150079|nr:ABC transporter permease [Pelagibacterium sp.]HWJ86624.1 ABC transporter permease [Pelagibacterium sp.]